jgi:hypothetical protein
MQFGQDSKASELNDQSFAWDNEFTFNIGAMDVVTETISRSRFRLTADVHIH